MKKIILLLLLNSFFLLALSQKQEQTIYQKKIREIEVKVCKAYRVSPSIIDDNSGNFKGLNLGAKLGFINRKQGNISREQEIEIMFATAALMKEAAKYKTDVDFKRERLEREKYNYNNSDYKHLKDSVIQIFSQWLQKGEFEKSNDYEMRMNSVQENFERINLGQIHSLLNKPNNEDRSSKEINSLISKKLLPYNADKEYFKILFEYKDIKWNDSISISINNAEEFKNDFDDDIERKYRITIDDDDAWRIVNNTWYPKLLVLKKINSEYVWKINVPLKNESNIIFSALQLGFNEPFLKDVKFNYDEYLEKKKQQEAIIIENKRKEILMIEEKRKKDSLILSEKLKQDSLIAEQTRIQDSIKMEEKKKQDSIIAEHKRIQDSIIVEQKRTQDSIVETKIKHELDSINVQETMNMDTLNNLRKQHYYSEKDISVRYNIKASNGLNKKKILIFTKYTEITNSYLSLENLATNTHNKIPFIRKIIIIDDNLISLKSNREIKEMAKRLETVNSNEEIEKVLSYKLQ